MELIYVEFIDMHAIITLLYDYDQKLICSAYESINKTSF